MSSQFDRRSFAHASAGIVAGAIMAPFAAATGPSDAATKSSGLVRPQLPPALKPGMRIGIPAPAGGVSKQDFESKLPRFRDAMNKLGLEIEVAKSVLAGSHSGTSYLAAPDEVRASEFMEFVKRSDIHGIVCMRGGYGVMRILPMLDFDIIRQHPKIICGYSDITALINAVYQGSNLVAFHGPIAAAELDPFSLKWFLSMVFRGDTVPEQPRYHQPETLVTIAPGKAQGRIVGGNLTLIASTMGTPYELNTHQAILFLEDVGEKPYRIDRMLTQLWLAGKLQNCAAIILGQFTEADETSNATSVDEVLRARLQSLGIPVLGNFPIGHVQEKLTIPIGSLAEVDAINKSVSILEPTVQG
jgi:muramoyltetrapeptide carboxypeptidase